HGVVGGAGRIQGDQAEAVDRHGKQGQGPAGLGGFDQQGHAGPRRPHRPNEMGDGAGRVLDIQHPAAAPIRCSVVHASRILSSVSIGVYPKLPYGNPPTHSKTMKVHNKRFTGFSITCYRVIYTIEDALSRGKNVKKGQNNAGPAFRPAPQRDPIFRDAKVLLFWCDQQQKEHWLDIPFCCHIGWVFTRTGRRSQSLPSLISDAVWCPAAVISNVDYW